MLTISSSLWTRAVAEDVELVEDREAVVVVEGVVGVS